MKYWNCLLVMASGFSTMYCEGTNVALNKTATQNSDLDFAGFLWTADKAVDGCTNQDNPDGERCCSASEGTGAGNYWKVDLGAQYNVELITVYGRSPGGDVQLAGFSVYTQATVSGTETLLYTQTGDYAPGIFNITVNPVRTVRSVVIRRPLGDIITLCEVEVYDFTITTTTSSTTSTTQPGQGNSIGVSIYTTGAIWTPFITLMSIILALYD